MVFFVSLLTSVWVELELLRLAWALLSSLVTTNTSCEQLDIIDEQAIQLESTTMIVIVMVHTNLLVLVSVSFSGKSY